MPKLKLWHLVCYRLVLPLCNLTQRCKYAILTTIFQHTRSYSCFSIMIKTTWHSITRTLFFHSIKNDAGLWSNSRTTAYWSWITFFETPCRSQILIGFTIYLNYCFRFMWACSRWVKVMIQIVSLIEFFMVLNAAFASVC